MCRSQASPPGGVNSPSTTKWVDSTTDSEPCPQVEPLFVVQDKVTPPYSVEVQVNGLPLHMEVDSGAAVSLATETAVASLLTTTELHPSDTVLKTYTGERIPVKGVLRVDVEYGQQRCTQLNLLVVQGSGPCLLGRDWLAVLRLDWRNIFKMTLPSDASTDERVQQLQQRYSD